MPVVVVGSVAYDSVKTATDERRRAFGGSASYFSIAASLFTDVKLVGVVGEDFEDEHYRLLQDHGVDTAGLNRVEGGKTFHWSGVYSDDFVERTTISTELNVFENFKPELTPEFRKCPVLFLGNIHPQLQLDVLNQMESLRFVACDTMNMWIENNLDSLKQVLKRIDLLTINDEEAMLLSGNRNVHLAADKILEMGPKYLIVKRGEFGSALYGEGKSFLLPAYPVKDVTDPTGAGDSFAGGLMGYLGKKKALSFDEIRQGVVTGTLVASFTVEDFSIDRLRHLTIDELAERRSRFAEMTAWYFDDR